MNRHIDHFSMRRVLSFLADSGPAESVEIADRLKLKSKHASMVLLRCLRRGFVQRKPYTRGTAHGYIYELTEKGLEWLKYKASQKKADQIDREPRATAILKPNIAVTIQVPEPKPQTLIDEQLENSITKFAMAKQVFQDFRPQKSLDQTMVEMLISKRNFERDISILYLTERNRRMQYEEMLKEVLRGNQEIFKFIVNLLKVDFEKRKIADNFQFRRSLMKTEALTDQRISHEEKVFSLHQQRLKEDQIERGHMQAMPLLYRDYDRWWDSLPQHSKNPSLPFRGPARTF